MSFADYITLSEAADRLNISEELVKKIIDMGLIRTRNNGPLTRLTRYNVRQLDRIVDLYEQSLPIDRIESIIND